MREKMKIKVEEKTTTWAATHKWLGRPPIYTCKVCQARDVHWQGPIMGIERGQYWLSFPPVNLLGKGIPKTKILLKLITHLEQASIVFIVHSKHTLGCFDGFDGRMRKLKLKTRSHFNSPINYMTHSEIQLKNSFPFNEKRLSLLGCPFCPRT